MRLIKYCKQSWEFLVNNWDVVISVVFGIVCTLILILHEIFNKIV